MKHSRYNEYYNYMSGNGKANIDKSGKNKDVSTLISNFDEKLKYWLNLNYEKYEDDKHYILRHEMNKLHRAFLNKENVMFSPSQIFTYKGKKYECEAMSLSLTFTTIEQSNKQIVFHDFFRNKTTGEIIILIQSI